MYMNQNTLPYPADRIAVPMVNLQYGPAFIPQIPCGSPIQENLGMLTAYAIAHIQTSAQASPNPSRIFMLNQMGMSDYRSNDFISLIAMAVDIASLYLTNPNNNNLSVVLKTAAENAVDYMCAMNVGNTPALMNIMPPHLLHGVHATVTECQNVMQQIENAKNQARSQAQNFNGGIQSFQMGNNMQGNNLGGNNLLNRGIMGSGIGMGTQPVQPTPVNSRYVRNDNNTVGGFFQEPNNQMSQVPTLGGAKEPLPVQNERTIQISQPETEWVIANVAGFIRSHEEPNYLAYDPTQFKLLMKTNANGTTTFQANKLESRPMDYSLHSKIFGDLNSANTMQPLGDPETRFAELTRAVKTINRQTEEFHDTPKEERDKLKLETISQRIASIYYTPEEGLFNAKREKLRYKGEKKPDIFRFYSIIADPIISETDETEIVVELNNCETYVELRDKLMELRPRMTSSLWLAVNRRITAFINRLLAQCLSLPKLQIDSFLDDLDDLMGLLVKKYGQTLGDAFVKHQSEHISALFYLIDEANKQIVDDYYLNDDPDSTMKMTYLASDNSFTVLDFTGLELNIELGAANVGAQVTERLCPVMYRLLEGIFDDTDRRENLFARHFILTFDGYVLEATRGQIANECYILTLINKMHE